VCGGCGKAHQVEGGSPAHHNDIRVPAHPVLVEIRPDRFNQAPVIFCLFSPPDKTGRAYKIEGVGVLLKIGSHQGGQVGVPIDYPLIQIDEHFGPFPGLFTFKQISKGGISRHKSVPGKENFMGEVEPDIAAYGGISIGHRSDK
jgi:hypothetical protein